MSREQQDALCTYVLAGTQTDVYKPNYGQVVYLKEISTVLMTMLGPVTYHGIFTLKLEEALHFLWPLSDTPERRIERLKAVQSAARWKGNVQIVRARS